MPSHTAPERVFSAELIDRLTVGIDYNREDVIQRPKLVPAAPGGNMSLSAPLSSLPVSSPPFCLGRLDCLPAELLDMVLNLLDCQALSRLGRTCRAAYVAVDELPAYCELRQHIPEVLAALGQTRMLRHHAVALLRKTLRSSVCASCLLAFGGFLLLPTCERVCHDCLQNNCALRMTTLGNAYSCFHLSPRQLKMGVPVLYTIPGTYGRKYHKKQRLVNVRQAKAFAVARYGTPLSAGCFTSIPPMRPPRMTYRRFYVLRQIYMASLEPPGSDLPLLTRSNMVGDDYAGVASIRIPYLHKSGVNPGRSCKGCQLVNRLYSHGGLPAAVLKRLVPPGHLPETPLHALTMRLYADEEFLQHAQSCYGVERLLSQWDDGTKVG